MFDDLTTEGRNPASEAIDNMAASEIVRVMNAEDAKVAEAVGRQREFIARAVEVIAKRLRRGGRLIYIGAGTSGRLGVLDAPVSAHVQYRAPSGGGCHLRWTFGHVSGRRRGGGRPATAVDDLEGARAFQRRWSASPPVAARRTSSVGCNMPRRSAHLPSA